MIDDGPPSLREEILELFEEAQIPIASSHSFATLFDRAPESRSWAVYKGRQSSVRMAAKHVEYEIEEARRDEDAERSIPCNRCGGPRRWMSNARWPSYCVGCSRRSKEIVRPMKRRYKPRPSRWSQPALMVDRSIPCDKCSRPREWRAGCRWPLFCTECAGTKEHAARGQEARRLKKANAA